MYIMGMRRNCNLDLRLSPLPSCRWPSYNGHHTSIPDPSTISQQVAIFYNGRINVCDVTELQARAIIWLASREMEQRINTARPNVASTSLHSQLCGPPGLSMKRSLQWFLQKRKKRSQATNPYAYSCHK